MHNSQIICYVPQGYFVITMTLYTFQQEFVIKCFHIYNSRYLDHFMPVGCLVAELCQGALSIIIVSISVSTEITQFNLILNLQLKALSLSKMLRTHFRRKHHLHTSILRQSKASAVRIAAASDFVIKDLGDTLSKKLTSSF